MMFGVAYGGNDVHECNCWFIKIIWGAKQEAICLWEDLCTVANAVE